MTGGKVTSDGVRAEHINKQRRVEGSTAGESAPLWWLAGKGIPELSSKGPGESVGRAFQAAGTAAPRAAGWDKRGVFGEPKNDEAMRAASEWGGSHRSKTR